MEIQTENALKLSGELIISGFSGLELPNSTQHFFKENQIGGVILFAPNFENPAQVAELINSIQECQSEIPLWISVDHEGGRVQRFKNGFTQIPDAYTIGKQDSPKLAFEIAEGMAAELKSVGINLNFAPIADILTNPKNPVIGHRSFGDTEELVSKIVSAQVRGHLSAGVQPCLKHFPGHGDTSVDSHFALPKIDTSLSTLIKRELKPFEKGYKSKAQMIMTAHIVCKQIDPEFPATLSKKILKELLREELQFEGLIISDDMEMKAITNHFGKEKAPLLAIEAGCDLLIYRSEIEAAAALTSIRAAIQSNELDPQLIVDAALRSRRIKKESLLPYNPVHVQELTGKLVQPALQELILKLNKKNK